MGRHRGVTGLRRILFSGHRTRPPVTTPRIRVVMTDGPTGTAHLIADEVLAADQRAAAGRYQAVCGAEVCAASLTTPARRHCSACDRD